MIVCNDSEREHTHARESSLRHTHGIVISSVYYFHCYFIWVYERFFAIQFILRNFIHLIRILCLLRQAYAHARAVIKFYSITLAIVYAHFRLCFEFDSIWHSPTVAMHAVLVPISINIWCVGLIYKQNVFFGWQKTTKSRKFSISAKFLMSINQLMIIMIAKCDPCGSACWHLFG